MRWLGRRQSDNIEDRRGSRAVRVGLGGGIGGVIMVVIVLLLGGDPRQLLQQFSQEEAEVGDQGGAAQGPVEESAGEAKLRQFIAFVLADTEDTWREIFGQVGRTYEVPTLVLFRDAVDSECGYASAAVGPFYCAENRKVYIDLGFFRELEERFGAPGDFAQAYVIAHEVGHHVQNLLGITGRSSDRGNRADANALSVGIELQADCLAGVWAHHAARSRELLEPGDIEEGLRAASAIGDDRIQMQTQGRVVPDSFTHGSSAERVQWFRRGIESGKIQACDR